MSQESHESSPGSVTCPCTEDTTSVESPLSVHCECPLDELGLRIHEEECLLYRHERFMYPHEPTTCECNEPPFPSGVCECCACLPDQCFCKKSGKEALDQWRHQRTLAGGMPAVLEATHPLMQKFQQTLKIFLDKENAIAEKQIINLRDELRLSKEGYDKDLEEIYRNDHDTNAQRVLIEEYESNLAMRTAEREEAERRAKLANDNYRKAKDKLDQDMMTEREASQELEALTTLCRQMETWREETESGLTVSHTVSDKMKKEKKAMADEKRELDMIIYGLNTEIWKLESKLTMFQKQLEIKNNEMENINDKVTAYAAELEDLELDKRRLVSLWNSVLVNIHQRDRVFDSVRDDYRVLQDNYRTLMSNLEITKKITAEEMEKGKEIAMYKDKLYYDVNAATKLFEVEDAKRNELETNIQQLTESIEMCERDQEMIKMENQGMANFLNTTEKELDRHSGQKLKVENEILSNLQECLLNDKAVESMANGIRKMRELSRKQEIALMTMESQHAKVMLDIEVYRARQARNDKTYQEKVEKVRAREREIDVLEETYEQNTLKLTRKQRDLDLITKKFIALKELFDMKSPQERRVDELECQIRSLRERTEEIQHEWLRLQGHVVKLTAQQHKLSADVNLIATQIQICDQKTMRIQAEIESVATERARVDRILRDLRGRLEVLERARKDALERNEDAQRSTMSVTHGYSASLKDAEAEIMQIEEDIETFDVDKTNLTQDLDRVQREALIWQRKGMMAVELKRNVQNAKSAAGEIGQMKKEIHKMEVRREQLRRIGEKLAEDLAHCVTQRDNAMEKSRAAAAVQRMHAANGQTSQSQYHHKLRLAKADVARVSKDVADATSRLQYLEREQERLQQELVATSEMNAQMEERVATLLRKCREEERKKQWLLERVVRSQRLSNELATAVKRQSLKVKKPKAQVHQDYHSSKKLNERIQHIVNTLLHEYPYMEDKLALIANTLNIESPGNSPRLVEECGCEEEVGEENVAEKPYCHCTEEMRSSDQSKCTSPQSLTVSHEEK